MAVVVLKRPHGLDRPTRQGSREGLPVLAWSAPRVEAVTLATAMATVLHAVECRHRSLKGTLDDVPREVAIGRWCECLDAFDAVVRLAEVLEVELPVPLEKVAPRNR